MRMETLYDGSPYCFNCKYLYRASSLKREAFEFLTQGCYVVVYVPVWERTRERIM